MYLDLIGSDTCIMMNIKMARLTDLETAVYLAELENILLQVQRKKKCDERGFFKLDRKYVEERTTLQKDVQYECDTILSKLGVLCSDTDNPDIIAISPQKIVELLIDDTVEPAKIKKKTKVNRAEAAEKKRAGQIMCMQSIVAQQMISESLQKALFSWVEAVYANKKFLTRAIIETFIAKVTSVADEATQLEIVNCAMVNAWTDADWAINSINRNKPKRSSVAINAPQQTSVGMDFNNKF